MLDASLSRSKITAPKIKRNLINFQDAFNFEPGSMNRLDRSDVPVSWGQLEKTVNISHLAAFGSKSIIPASMAPHHQGL